MSISGSISNFFNQEAIDLVDLSFLIFHVMIFVKSNLCLAHWPSCLYLLDVLNKLFVLKCGLRVNLGMATFICSAIFNHADGMLTLLLLILCDFFWSWFLSVNLLKLLFVKIVGSLREFLVNFVGDYRTTGEGVEHFDVRIIVIYARSISFIVLYIINFECIQISNHN
jgi:hypothetical protein